MKPSLLKDTLAKIFKAYFKKCKTAFYSFTDQIKEIFFQVPADFKASAIYRRKLRKYFDKSVEYF